MIVGGVEKLLELRVGDRILVDVERLDLQRVFVKAARRIFPRILHIDADIVESFDFDSRDLEEKVALRESLPSLPDAPVAAFVGWIGTICCGRTFHSCE